MVPLFFFSNDPVFVRSLRNRAPHLCKPILHLCKRDLNLTLALNKCANGTTHFSLGDGVSSRKAPFIYLS